jgi:hypothetical protein
LPGNSAAKANGTATEEPDLGVGGRPPRAPAAFGPHDPPDRGRRYPEGVGRANIVEGMLLLAQVAGYLAALVLVLSPLQAAAVLVVQQGLFGLYLGCSFAPNHLLELATGRATERQPCQSGATR